MPVHGLIHARDDNIVSSRHGMAAETTGRATKSKAMEEDPSKVPEIPGEDHAEFRETFVSRHPLTLFFQSIVSLTASSLRESKIILSMVLFTSTR